MFWRFFRRLISKRPKVAATGPGIQTALRRSAAAEAQPRGQTARDRYIEIAAALKAEAGIDLHTVNERLSGGGDRSAPPRRRRTLDRRDVRGLTPGVPPSSS